MHSSTWSCASCGCEVEASERPAMWCPACGCTGLWQRPWRRPVADALAGAAVALTAAEVVRQSWALRRCGATGEPWASPALWLLVGGPGAGKSTLALQVAAGSSPVVVLSAEEAPGPSLARRLVVADMGQRRDVSIVRQIGVAALAACGRGGAIVVDSVTATPFRPGDLRGLLDAGAELVVGTVQVTKAGLPAGSNELLHEADVALELEAGTWRCFKSRFGSTGGEGRVKGVVPAPTNNKEDPHVR